MQHRSYTTRAVVLFFIQSQRIKLSFMVRSLSRVTNSILTLTTELSLSDNAYVTG